MWSLTSQLASGAAVLANWKADATKLDGSEKAVHDRRLLFNLAVTGEKQNALFLVLLLNLFNRVE